MLRSKSMAETNGENLIGFIASTVETIHQDVAKIRREMVTVARYEAGNTALRGEIEQVHLRLDGIERSISSRLDSVEGQVSRIRSAVYILGKDRPDVLRLLGQNSG